MTQRTVTIIIPEGYASGEEFAKDCGFEIAKRIAIDKELERSKTESGPEMREREHRRLRKPLKLNVSDEWCLEAADREAVTNGERRE